MITLNCHLFAFVKRLDLLSLDGLVHCQCPLVLCLAQGVDMQIGLS